MNHLVFYAAVCTDVGQYRQNNEDNYFLLRSHLPEGAYYGQYVMRSVVAHEGIVAVFDGMGGESQGEDAAGIAAKMVAEYRDKLLSLEIEDLQAYCRSANEAICKRSEEIGSMTGSTMAFAAIRNGLCTTANIGDSRIYLLHQGNFQQLSKDHTVTAGLVQMGMLTPEQAKKDQRRHQLTQHLGIMDDIEPAPHVRLHFPLYADDRLLLCSDGVTDALSDEELQKLLEQDQNSCERIAKGIVDSAKNAGSMDNLTALVVKVGYQIPKTENISQEMRLAGLETTVNGIPPWANKEQGTVGAGKGERNTSLQDSVPYDGWLCTLIRIMSGLLSFSLGILLALLLF